MKPIIEIQNISKKFRIHHERQSYLSLRDTISNVFHHKLNTSEDFYALSDVSFDVFPGESIGIIGKNGAGKSTLLKILSKITPPTSGKIISRGRIASLLEVGTGFHGELSGRENIFLNGSILGMKRLEIQKNFDEIVDFSGVEKFLDTPLKHYSSGMQLRLAFAVAAFLKNEILIIDEVLAVGDAEFQKKCLGKMEDISKNQGRTVLFVSHNMPSINTICTKGILLQSGKIVQRGDIDHIINYYSSDNHENEKIADGVHYFQPLLKVNNIVINNSDINSIFVHDQKLRIEIDFNLTKNTTFELDVHIKKESYFICSYSNFVNKDVKKYDAGNHKIIYEIDLPKLRSGMYKVDLFFTEPFSSWFAKSEDTINLEILNDQHHIFLNNSSLKWGSVLMDGRIKK
jgi:lipopolysaccharide transport system ATP-binding protein